MADFTPRRAFTQTVELENIPPNVNSLDEMACKAESNAKVISASKELLHSLKWAQDQIKILEKQISLKNSPNLLTEKGKRQWEEFSAGMIKIEKAIAKAEGR